MKHTSLIAALAVIVASTTLVVGQTSHLTLQLPTGVGTTYPAELKATNTFTTTTNYSLFREESNTTLSGSTGGSNISFHNNRFNLIGSGGAEYVTGLQHMVDAKQHTGHIQELTANRARLEIGSTGTQLHLTMYETWFNGVGTGTVTNWYGFKVRDFSANTNPMTNVYGVYIGDITQGPQTNVFGLYESDSNAKNFFAGRVDIGTTTTPATSTMFTVKGISNFDGLVNIGTQGSTETSNLFKVNAVSHFNGKVGIGTASPSVDFSIATPVNPGMTIGTSSAPNILRVGIATEDFAMSGAARTNDVVIRKLNGGNSIVFDNQSQTGITDAAYKFAYNGVPVVSISKEGRIGIGEQAPAVDLAIKGTTAGITGARVAIGDNAVVGQYSASTSVLRINSADASYLEMSGGGKGVIYGVSAQYGVGIYVEPTLDYSIYHGTVKDVSVKPSGLVEIGPSAVGEGTDRLRVNGKTHLNGTLSITDATDTYVPAGFKLAVNGKIMAEEVQVLLRVNWPDYVFDSTYTLPSINEVESFIQANKHLPSIPSAQEVSDKGIAIGEMNALLLRKIEELTLYIIEQNKRINQLETVVGK